MPGSDLSSEEALDRFYEALRDDDAEALYEQAPCGYLSTTPDGTIVKVNGTFLTWTGYQRTDLIGRRRFADLLSAGGRIYHETHYAPLLHGPGRAREIALDFVCADGRRLPALVNAVLERDRAGKPLVIRAAVFEASQRRAYERELLEAKQRAEASERQARLLADTLQRSLRPPALPRIPGLELAAAYRPAATGDEIGGDFYDVFPLSADEWVVVIGDVQGKGVDAAVVAGLVRHTLWAAAVDHPRPSRVLQTVNQVLLAHGSRRFCTATLVLLRRSPAGWEATVSAGGHPLPVLLRAGRGPVDLGRHGTLLGALDTIRLHDDTHNLERGDSLVLFTDGVIEARRGTDWFGEHRLRAALTAHSASPSTLTEGILDEVLRFQDGAARDDVALVAVRAR